MGLSTHVAFQYRCQCLPLWRAPGYFHDSSGILLDRTAKNAKGAKKE